MELEWDVIFTEIGDALVVTSSAGIVLLDLLDGDPTATVDRVGRTLGADAAHRLGVGSDAERQIAEYLAGRRRTFDLALDLALVGGFSRDVLSEIGRIGYGTTASYGTVAARAGRPLASRAVGTACRLSPFVFVAPVHRVVHADGTPGAYGPRPQLKAELIALELAVLSGATRVGIAG